MGLLGSPEVERRTIVCDPAFALHTDTVVWRGTSNKGWLLVLDLRSKAPYSGMNRDRLVIFRRRVSSRRPKFGIPKWIFSSMDLLNLCSLSSVWGNFTHPPNSSAGVNFLDGLECAFFW